MIRNFQLIDHIVANDAMIKCQVHHSLPFFYSNKIENVFFFFYFSCICNARMDFSDSSKRSEEWF